MGAVYGIPSEKGRFYTPASPLPNILNQVEGKARECLNIVENMKRNSFSPEVVSWFKSHCRETEKKLRGLQSILIVLEKQPSQWSKAPDHPVSANVRGPTECPAMENFQTGAKIDMQHKTGPQLSASPNVTKSESKPGANVIETLKARNDEMQTQLESALEELKRNAKTIEELNSETDNLRLR